MAAGAMTGPDDPDGAVHAGNVTAAEQAAWDVAVQLGLPVTRADLRSLLRAALVTGSGQEAAGTGCTGTDRDGAPVTVFAASNSQLPALLDRYRTLCKIAGSPPGYLQRIQENRDRVIRWQAANPGELRVPGSNSGCGRRKGYPVILPPGDNTPATVNKP
jgi:hypothetical protein